jgi:hypothetical protein
MRRDNNTYDNSQSKKSECFLVIVIVLASVIVLSLFPSVYNEGLFNQHAYAIAESLDGQAFQSLSFSSGLGHFGHAALLERGSTIVGITGGDSSGEISSRNDIIDAAELSRTAATTTTVATNLITYSTGEICNNGADDNTDGQIDEGCNLSPDCSTAIPSQTLFLSTDHHLEEIRIGGAFDPNNDPIVLTITDIIQDEPINGLGNNDQSPDALVVAGDTVQLRSERAENGDGRVYYISFVANDSRGGQCDGVVAVNVPNNQIGLAIDSGTYFSSLK